MLRQFEPSKIMVMDRYFEVLKHMVVDRNFGPLKIAKKIKIKKIVVKVTVNTTVGQLVAV